MPGLRSASFAGLSSILIAVAWLTPKVTGPDLSRTVMPPALPMAVISPDTSGAFSGREVAC